MWIHVQEEILKWNLITISSDVKLAQTLKVLLRLFNTRKENGLRQNEFLMLEQKWNLKEKWKQKFSQVEVLQCLCNVNMCPYANMWVWKYVCIYVNLSLCLCMCVCVLCGHVCGSQRLTSVGPQALSILVHFSSSPFLEIGSLICLELIKYVTMAEKQVLGTCMFLFVWLWSYNHGLPSLKPSYEFWDFNSVSHVWLVLYQLIHYRNAYR